MSKPNRSSVSAVTRDFVGLGKLISIQIMHACDDFASLVFNH